MGIRSRLAAAFAFVIMGCGGGGGTPEPDAANDAADLDGRVANTSLAGLLPSLGELDPPFEPGVLAYDLRLAVDDTEVAFTPTAAASAPVALLPGRQTVEIVVSSGESATTYVVTVHRGAPDLRISFASADLTHRMTPGFAPGTMTYAASVGYLIHSIQLTIVPQVAGSTISVGGGPATAGEPSPPFALNVGLTSIPVVITPPGGSPTAYQVNVTRGADVAQQAYLKASNTDPDDFFGLSLDVHGDTIVVGAVGEASAATGVDGDQADDSASDSGAAYVFRGSGSTWTQEAYLKASNTNTNDGFGQSVAIDGDTIVVGAPGEDSAATGVDGNQADNSASGAGAVYVFVRTGTTWTQQAYLKASNTDAGDQFGSAVAIDGDTLVVGATGEDSAATTVDGDQDDDSSSFAGAAYVFTRTDGVWSQRAYLKSSPVAGVLGVAVSISGDTIAVGALGGIGGKGSVWIFRRNGASWALEASPPPPGDTVDLELANSEFGTSVAVWGDTLSVGAPLGFNSICGCTWGSVHVYTRTGTTWSAPTRLSQGLPDAELGRSGAIWEDVVASGAPADYNGATGVTTDMQGEGSKPNSGAAYLHRLGTSTANRKLKASNSAADDYFSVVSIWADTLVVGAYQEDSNATGVGGDQSNNSAASSGAVYVIR